MLSGNKASQKDRGEQRQLHFDDSGINDDNIEWSKKGREVVKFHERAANWFKGNPLLRQLSEAFSLKAIY